MVHRINDVLRRDHAATEPASIQAADRILATLHTVKFDVDLAVVVVEAETDMHDVAVLVLAFFFDVAFEFFLPVWFGFSTIGLAIREG